jgi:N-acetylneuraminic acid mutarotase
VTSRSPSSAVRDRSFQMVTTLRSAILFGLCLALTSCDNTRPDLTAPAAEESSALDAATLATSNTWTTKRQIPSPPGGRAGTLNGIIYVMGGRNSSGQSLPMQAYNLSTNSWSTRRALPSARGGVNGVTPLKGKLFVTGGSNSSGQLTRSLFIYDPATDTWSRGADMPQAAGCGIQGAINGQLYVWAGCIGVPVVPDAHRFFRYNPHTNRWATLAPPPRRHTFGPFGGALGDKFYMGGGWWDHAPTGFVYAYDPATNTWADRASRSHAFGAFAVVDGKLYVAGGIDDVGLHTNDLSVYDPVSNTWATKAPMPILRSNAIGAAGGRRFFVIGGSGRDEDGNDVDASRRVDMYTP